MCSRFLKLLCLLFGLITVNTLRAEFFDFGNDANGMTGLQIANVTNGGFTLEISASPSGSVLNESKGGGIGVDTTGVADTVDSGNSKMTVVGGSSPLAGEGEAVVFSFGQPGVLRELHFDALKDETLEFFTITFPDSTVKSFFDFEVPMRVTDQSFTMDDLGVPNPTLALDASDDYVNVNYAFSAGDTFTVQYGEIDFATLLPGYVPLAGGSPNGSRFSGIVVSAVPEPGLGSSGLALLMGFGLFGRKRRR